MEFKVYGPFEMPRTHTGLVAHAAAEKRAFWENVDEVEAGLSGACGCYVFALQPPGGSAKPWYVGRTRNAGGFRTECFASHKIVHYNSAISDYQRAVPQLYLIAKVTPRKHAFSKPNSNGHNDVADLEEFLIGIAYSRNRHLVNIRGTAFLRDAKVPGVLNSPPGNPGAGASALKVTLGL
ncbi:MAG: hypothetical protein R3B70_04500 [Polyangiaceae bacterium]